MATLKSRRTSRLGFAASLAGGALLALTSSCASGEGGRPIVSREDMNHTAIPVEFREMSIEIKECYTGALLASDGKVYMATSAKPKPARLLAYDPKKDTIEVLVTFTSGALQGGPDGKPLPRGTKPVLKGEDVSGLAPADAWLYGQDKIHTRLYEGPDGRIYGATDSGVGDEQVDNTRRYGGGHFFAYDPKTGKTEDLGWARRHEGIIAMCMDKKRGVIYGLTWPSGQLYACRLKPSEGQPRITMLGLTSGGLQGVPRYFDVLKDGRVFICDGSTGDILVYVPADYEGKFEPPLGVKGRLVRPARLTTPTRPDPVKNPRLLRHTGRFRNWWFWGTRSPDGMRIYSTNQRRGQMFEVDGGAGIFGRVIDHPHVKPWSGFGAEWTGASIRIMNFSRNGLLYYHASSQLLSYDPKSGEVRDWGYMVRKDDRKVGVNKLGTGLTSVAADGTMYFTGTRRGCLLKAAEKPGDKPEYEIHYGLVWFNPAKLRNSKLHYTEPRRKK